MTLHPLPLLSTLTALALLTASPARAAWLGSALPSAAAPAIAASMGERFSFLDSTMADGDDESDADDSVWALAHLTRQARVEAPAPLLESEQATPPLSAARAEDGSTVGRRAAVSARLQTAEAATLEPRQQAARPEFSMAQLDPTWIALSGAMLALMGWRLQRRKQRERRPAMLYVAR